MNKGLLPDRMHSRRHNREDVRSSSVANASLALRKAKKHLFWIRPQKSNLQRHKLSIYNETSYYTVHLLKRCQVISCRTTTLEFRSANVFPVWDQVVCHGVKTAVSP